MLPCDYAASKSVHTHTLFLRRVLAVCSMVPTSPTSTIIVLTQSLAIACWFDVAL